jgi:hypothetical protein
VVRLLPPACPMPPQHWRLPCAAAWPGCCPCAPCTVAGSPEGRQQPVQRPWRGACGASRALGRLAGSRTAGSADINLRRERGAAGHPDGRPSTGADSEAVAGRRRQAAEPLRLLGGAAHPALGSIRSASDQQPAPAAAHCRRLPSSAHRMCDAALAAAILTAAAAAATACPPAG